jgi:hypothetical protein
MLAEIPGLDAMLPPAGLLPPLFGYDVRKHVLAALAEHYRECPGGERDVNGVLRVGVIPDGYPP